jgi:hypothetical protein
MFYCRRASPKHRYDIIEVDYGGGGHRTRLRDPRDQLLLCLEVPPAPVYKGARGRCGRPGEGAPGGVLLPLGVGLPPFLVGIGFGRRKRERERRKEGPDPLALNQFGLGLGGARPTLALLPSFFTKAHVGPLSPWGVPVTSRYSGKIPISPRTLSISKYRLTIYQSLCLDHFETPHHVRDHIRDSELTSVHQNS